MKLVFDIETNGLLDEMTVIHCIVAKNYDTDELHVFRPNQIDEGVEFLSKATTLIGHNIIDFDIRAIRKLYPNFRPLRRVRDTLVMSRVVFPNLMERDSINLNDPAVKMNREDFQVWDSEKEKYVSAVGRHSLEAWGLRLKHKKGDYAKENDWSTFSEEMLEYCIQDVSVNTLLYRTLNSRKPNTEVLDLEMDIQFIITEQSTYGWYFDKEFAVEVYSKMASRRKEIEKLLSHICTGWDELTKTPAYWSAKISDLIEIRKETKGTLERVLKQRFSKEINPATGKKWLQKDLKNLCTAGPLKTNHTFFKPKSTKHFARFFKEKYDWEPQHFTEKGSVKVDEVVLQSFQEGKEKYNLEYEKEVLHVTKLLLEYAILQDRIAKVAEGKDGGYLGHLKKDQRLHGYVNTLGTNTHRATHSRPNLAQVPANSKPFGHEFRGFFTTPKGYKLLGTDASGQELRILAHLLAVYGDESFAKEVVEGDVHTRNQEAMKLPTRDNAKTAIYALLYGAGATKMGKIVGGGAKEGKEIRAGFEQSVPAYVLLNDQLKEEAREKGGIIGIDGRFLPVSAEYRALNYIIQSAGAIIAKRWMWFIKKEIMKRGLDAHQVGWIHDELQFEVLAEQAEELGDICKWAMKETEKFYNFKCPLDADFKIGNNWSETH